MKSFDQITVVAACDDGFAELVTVMLLSAFTQTRSRPLDVFLIVPEGFSHQAKIVESLGSHASKVTFCVVKLDGLDGVKVRSALPASAYLRLLVTDIVPPELDRVLYLDCDLLIRADLAPLWDTDLGDFCIGVAHDELGGTRHALDLADRLHYFNSGVMLIDLKRWREEDVGARAVAYAKQYPEKMLMADQCALNAVLHQRWLAIDPRWNVMRAELGQELAEGHWRYNQDAKQKAAKAAIIHFNSLPKPSFFMCDHPTKPEYDTYRKRTAWAHSKPADQYPHNMIIKFLRSYAPLLLPPYLMLRRII
eukprot:gene5223-5275_t